VPHAREKQRLTGQALPAITSMLGYKENGCRRRIQVTQAEHELPKNDGNRQLSGYL